MDPIALSQRTTGHYINSWRVPKDIQPIPSSPIRLAIITFRLSSPDEVTYRYATNGLGSHVCGGETPWRSEFYVSTQRASTSAFALLTALGSYAVKSDEGIAPYDTLPLAADTPLSGRFAGLIAVPPEPLDPEYLGVVSIEIREPLLVTRLVGLTEDELDLAIEIGGEKFWRQRQDIWWRHLDSE